MRDLSARALSSTKTRVQGQSIFFLWLAVCGKDHCATSLGGIGGDYSTESPKSLQIKRLLLHMVLPVFLRILSHLGFYSPFYPCED